MEKERLLNELEARGRGAQTALAAHLGYSASVTNKLIHTPRKITADEAVKIQEWLDKNPAGAEISKPAKAEPTPGPAHPPQPILPDDRVPGQLEVWASAEGGEQGAMLITTGPIDFIPRPAGLPVRGSFAVYLIGDSMSPAYDHGDQLYVNTNKPIRAGLDCLFVRELEDGSLLALAKRLVRPTADKWRVQQFNPPKEFELDRRKWSKAWMVAGKMNRT